MWSEGVLLLCLFCCVTTHPDEIHRLPGLTEKINFRQYGGYLNASEDETLFYWFVESQQSPSEDPVLLWIGGSIGCSSLDDFFTENGPFRFVDNETLRLNPFSWNKVANILFLESPIGTGFSNDDYYDESRPLDEITDDNYRAVKHFFKKFPSFKKNDFYIGGESLAGVFIPDLLVRISHKSADINYKGFIVGNGFFDKSHIADSLIFFAYYHGFVSPYIWDAAVKYCCGGVPTRYNCDFSKNVTAGCKQIVTSVLNSLISSNINFYNIHSHCSVSAKEEFCSTRDSIDQITLMNSFSFFNLASCGGSLCTHTRNITSYLKNHIVQKAIHADIPIWNGWAICNDFPVYQFNSGYETTRPQILELIQSQKIRALIYNGDMDMTSNFLGVEWFLDDLGLPLEKKYAPWQFENQVAGFAKSYTNLTFTTITGSGHKVSHDKPGVAFNMITSFFSNKPL